MFRLWLPWAAVLVLLAAGALICASCVLAKYKRWFAAALMVAAAAFIVRLYAASDGQLHPWDERYHALVAKHLIDEPLRPVLYADPVLPYDRRDWHRNHVWLHKPPLTLWMQAASMKAFGVHELPMRLPSILFSTLAVLVTFRIGGVLFSARIGLVAAVFHAVNGFLVDLASGRRASDHVDTLLILLIEAGVLAGLLIARPWPRLAGVAIGVACGLAYLTKSLSGLVLLPIWGAIRWQLRVGARGFLELALAGGVAMLIAIPWVYFTQRTFPVESQQESSYVWRHVTEILETHGGPPWQYLKDMPRDFGELIYLPLGFALFTAFSGAATAGLRIALLWVAVPYIVYSAMATKMPGYVMVAAPALFLIQGDFWVRLQDVRRREPRRARRVLIAIVLGALALSAGRHLMSPAGPLENGPRTHQWVQDLQAPNREIGVAKAVIFNVPTPIEAMFYTSYIAYDHMPTSEQIEASRERGYQVFIYEPRTAGRAPSLVSAQ